MSEWTAKDVEFRVLEAAETLMRSPNSYVGGGSAWPEYIPHYPRAMKVRIRPTPAQLSRMAETWGWINAHPMESDRKLLYAWAWQKTKRGRFLNDFASREGVNSRTLRRIITRICQAIADTLNQRKIMWMVDGVDVASEIEPELAPSNVASPTHASHMMAPGAKPVHIPDHPDTKALVERLEKAGRKRAGEKRDIATSGRSAENLSRKIAREA